MKRLSVLCGCLMLLTLGCGGGAEESAAAPGVTFPEIAGWEPVGEIQTFDSETLYDYINGAADAYLSYGFEQLRVRDLTSGELTVTVSIYDMATPLNAFGIYRTEVPASEGALDVGAEARLAPPYQAFLLKDRYYVKVDALEGDFDEAAAEGLLRSIADALPGDPGFPPALDILPEDGRVSGSVAFTKEGLLGLSELKECVHATYEVADAGTTFVGFVMLPGDGETVGTVWDRLAETWRATEIDGQTVLWKETPYDGLVGVVREADDHVFGASGADDTAHLARRLERISGVTLAE